jgi:hypothetical protein
MSKIARPINLTAAVAILAVLLITAGPAAARSAGWPDPADPFTSAPSVSAPSVSDPFISGPYVSPSQDLRSPDARTPVVDLTPPSHASPAAAADSPARHSSGGVNAWAFVAIGSLVLAVTLSVLLLRERRRRRPVALGS